MPLIWQPQKENREGKRVREREIEREQKFDGKKVR
jgi:hypothetical protein